MTSTTTKRPPTPPEGFLGWRVYPVERRLFVFVPLRTKTGLNAREHWNARARRVKKEHQAVALCWPRTVKLNGEPIHIPLPCVVTMTRVSPGNGADSDGVVGGLKGVRDAVAKLLGTGDGPKDPVEWKYGQRRGPWAVEIEVTW